MQSPSELPGLGVQYQLSRGTQLKSKQRGKKTSKALNYYLWFYNVSKSDNIICQLWVEMNAGFFFFFFYPHNQVSSGIRSLPFSLQLSETSPKVFMPHKWEVARARALVSRELLASLSSFNYYPKTPWAGHLAFLGLSPHIWKMTRSYTPPPSFHGGWGDRMIRDHWRAVGFWGSNLCLILNLID